MRSNAPAKTNAEFCSTSPLQTCRNDQTFSTRLNSPHNQRHHTRPRHLDTTLRFSFIPTNSEPSRRSLYRLSNFITVLPTLPTCISCYTPKNNLQQQLTLHLCHLTQLCKTCIDIHCALHYNSQTPSPRLNDLISYP